MYLAVAFVCYVNGSCVFLNGVEPIGTLDACVAANSLFETEAYKTKKVNLIRTYCFILPEDS
jgi:hypothetical protein